MLGTAGDGRTIVPIGPIATSPPEVAREAPAPRTRAGSSGAGGAWRAPRVRPRCAVGRRFTSAPHVPQVRRRGANGDAAGLAETHETPTSVSALSTERTAAGRMLAQVRNDTACPRVERRRYFVCGRPGLRSIVRAARGAAAGIPPHPLERIHAMTCRMRRIYYTITRLPATVYGQESLATDISASVHPVQPPAAILDSTRAFDRGSSPSLRPSCHEGVRFSLGWNVSGRVAVAGRRRRTRAPARTASARHPSPRPNTTTRRPPLSLACSVYAGSPRTATPHLAPTALSSRARTRRLRHRLDATADPRGYPHRRRYDSCVYAQLPRPRRGG